MGEPDPKQQSRELADDLLKTLRERRAKLNPGEPGGRELSEAITCIETGSMWMIRSEFAGEGEYSPLLKLKPATE